jgi:hypothetical protein
MSSMLTPKDLAMMASNIEDELLPDTATINRPGGWVSDGQGGRTAGSATSTTAPVRLSALSGDELYSAQRVAAEAQWSATFPAFTDVRVTDTVTVLGKTLEVLWVGAPKSNEVQRKTLLKEVD